MSYIKALVLDVDGVIVGEKKGYNSPYPHTNVITKLKEIRNKGIPIILCTAKPHFAIEKIIRSANLANPHVTSAGSLIIDPIDKKILSKSNIGTKKAQLIIKTYLNENIYLEIYSLNDYYAQKNQLSDITSKHSHILDKEPILVDSLSKTASKIEITKIMPIVKNDKDKEKAKKLFDNLNMDLSIYWGTHPTALPFQFGNITPKGFTKKKGVKDILFSLKIDFKDTLGVGDSLDDWQFISLCGYGATLENGKDELKKLIKTKEKGKYFIGPSVDQNGILDIFNYFL